MNINDLIISAILTIITMNLERFKVLVNILMNGIVASQIYKLRYGSFILIETEYWTFSFLSNYINSDTFFRSIICLFASIIIFEFLIKYSFYFSSNFIFDKISTKINMSIKSNEDKKFVQEKSLDISNKSLKYIKMIDLNLFENIVKNFDYKKSFKNHYEMLKYFLLLFLSLNIISQNQNFYIWILFPFLIYFSIMLMLLPFGKNMIKYYEQILKDKYDDQ